MIIRGIQESPVHEKILALLKTHDVVYLHRSVSAEGEGWIVSMNEEPEDPDSPETLVIRVRRRAS